MAYIQVDFEAIENSGAASPLIGLPPTQVLGGLVKLWAWCWHEKTDQASSTQVEAFMAGGSPRTLEALTAFGFLEPRDGGHRVKGAERYLRLSAARARGAAATNERRTSVAHATHKHALTASSDQRAVNSEQRTPPLALLTEPEVLEVFSHWRARTGGGGPEKPGKQQASHIRARLRENRTPADLKLVVDGAMADIKNWPGRVGQLGIHILFRDDDSVRKFMILAEFPNGVPKPTARGSAAL